MQSVLKDKNDIKIFILYLMRHVGYPLEFPDINDIVIQDGVVGYFDFAECFAELLDIGNLAEEKVDGTDLYYITERGIQVTDTLDSSLMNTIREKSLKNALRLLSFKKRGADLKCIGDELEDGHYRITCIIWEHNEEILRLSVVLDNRSQFERMKANFYDKPEIVYRGILALLSGEVNYLLE
jgi:hypothetical protein